MYYFYETEREKREQPEIFLLTPNTKSFNEPTSVPIYSVYTPDAIGGYSQHDLHFKNKYKYIAPTVLNFCVIIAFAFTSEP